MYARELRDVRAFREKGEVIKGPETAIRDS